MKVKARACEKRPHKQQYHEAIPQTPSRPNLQLKELEGKLRETINGLPDSCRTIFQLSS